jgi:disulfide bond formation protein DsbB
MTENPTQKLSDAVSWRVRNRIALSLIGFGMAMIVAVGFFDAPADLVWPMTMLISGTAGVYFAGAGYEAVRNGASPRR